jgi:hypothetical protein
MTDAAIAPAAPGAAASDLLNRGGAVPPAVPAWQPALPIGYDAPEAVSARAEIKDRIADKEFGAKLLRKDEAATKEWDALHKAGYPAPQQITSADDVQAQAAARNEKEWSTFIAALGTQWQITPEQISELRNGVVREDIRNIALQRRDAMVKDKAWYRRLLDGDRQAKEEWSKVVADIGLRPVKVQS